MHAANPVSGKGLDGHVALAKLRQLSSAERLLVGLHFYECLTCTEIAAVLNRPTLDVEADLDAVFVKLATDPAQPEPLPQYVRAFQG